MTPLPPGYRRLMTFYIMNAKLPATRDRRLSQLIESCEKGKRLMGE